MIALLIFGIAVVLLLLLLLRLTREPGRPRGVAKAGAGPPIEELFPLHCRHFPGVRQALSPIDLAYLKKRTSPRILRRVRADRRAVAFAFLAGLKQDFTRLERLGRTVASLAPHVSRKQETERLWLGLRFRIFYGLVWLRVATGSVSVPQLARLTDMVGSMAARLEGVMAALEEASMARLRSELSV